MAPDLGKGRVDAFAHPELIEVRAVGGIEQAAAVIACVAVVIGDSLAAAVVISATDIAWDICRAAVIAAVDIGNAFVTGKEVLLFCAECGGGRQQVKRCELIQNVCDGASFHATRSPTKVL